MPIPMGSNPYCLFKRSSRMAGLLAPSQPALLALLNHSLPAQRPAKDIHSHIYRNSSCSVDMRFKDDQGCGGASESLRYPLRKEEKCRWRKEVMRRSGFKNLNSFVICVQWDGREFKRYESWFIFHFSN